jgi:hypothetical protein
MRKTRDFGEVLDRMLRAGRKLAQAVGPTGPANS